MSAKAKLQVDLGEFLKFIQIGMYTVYILLSFHLCFSGCQHKLECAICFGLSVYLYISVQNGEGKSCCLPLKHASMCPY